ncbi:MAG: glycosyltransferase [Candidatus Aminicenantes bacterium]|nr:glycosyltransferase [Candidatus Aminicenantes bacterium]
MEKIRVLEMIDQPFLGGGQINLLSLARNLDKEKFEVFTCSRGGGSLVEEIEKNDLQHFPVPFSKRIGSKIVREIRAILSDNRIDILHTHGGIAGFYGRWAARKCRTPVVVHTLHGIHYLHYRNFLLKHSFIFLERYFSRFTQAVIFVSEADKEKSMKFKLAPEEKMHIIKNGVDLSAFQEEERLNSTPEMRKEVKLESFQPLVGTVARLHRQKGIPYLLKAAKTISQVFPRIKILIVGGGPLEQKLERMARRWGVKEYVWFMGERKDAQDLTSLFEVFVLPSLWEGLPYVLMEASVLGKPIVATDVDGNREIIEDGKTGILVPARDPEKLAEAIIRLLRDKGLASKLAERAKEAVPLKFKLSRMVEETQDLYLKLYQRV